MMIGVAATVMGPAFSFILKEFSHTIGSVGFLASAWNVGYLLTDFRKPRVTEIKSSISCSVCGSEM
jgi:hypothetical protein